MVIEDVVNKETNETVKGLTFAVETEEFGKVTTVGFVPEDSPLWKEVALIMDNTIKAKRASLKGKTEKLLENKKKKNENS